MIKMFIKYLKIMICVFCISGCASSPFTGDRMKTLTVGMPQQQALNVAGDYDGFEPLNSNTMVYKYINRHMSGWNNYFTNNYFTNYYLVFQDNKLISVNNDKPWIDTSLADALQVANQNMQNQQALQNQENAIRMQQFNEMQRLQQQQYYQNRQIQLDQERNNELRNINNTLLFKN